MYNKRVKNGWAFYDWANSVYSLVISTAVFPIYFSQVSPQQIQMLGAGYESSAVYSFSLTLSFFIVALLSPLLSGIADYTGNKKAFMQFFAYLGAAACSGLYFFDSSNIWLGLSLSVVASVGFWGSLVFYNAFLPEIAPAKEQDALSAKGFALGYIGASLLLILNLAMITLPETFGLSGAGQATRLSFLMVGIWWAGFAQVTFARLPKNPHGRSASDERYFWRGFRELRAVALQLKEHKRLRRFLYAFFFYSTGVQTIILLASLFGDQELALDSNKLIATILIIQFVAIGGAYLFSFLSRRLGNLGALKISVVVWIAICIAAYGLSKSDPMVEYKFYAVGGLVGLVMGGIQSLSRSTYSKLLPASKSNASFFSFYDVSEKIAIIAGTFTYGYFVQVTGSMKTSALALSVYFIIGLILLYRVPRGPIVH